MKVSELMKGYTPSTTFEGFATNDDWVLAVGINLAENATENDYTVVQLGISGLDPQRNSGGFIRSRRPGTVLASR